MIYEESEEEICSKSTNITTDMCEYDDEDITENEEAEIPNEEIQEQDSEMILK